MNVWQKTWTTMFQNKLYVITKKSHVPPENSILRSVWSHIQNNTPSGDIYRHISRLYVDRSTQKRGIDDNKTHS